MIGVIVYPSGVGSIIINVLFLFSFSSVEQIIQCTVAIATTIIMCVCDLLYRIFQYVELINQSRVRPIDPRIYYING